ncbi:hypothetical protein [Bradyrhizobium guangxiense]|uniref:hypothetical protein n=1 Tax=Bradyrhizobium guangxiense TaxID=1325115 RepID=UPI0013E8D95E|nr:hypothetical protein [Bradyrhizobium guangxiense]
MSLLTTSWVVVLGELVVVLVLVLGLVVEVVVVVVVVVANGAVVWACAAEAMSALSTITPLRT